MADEAPCLIDGSDRWLSICIATRSRCALLPETLSSALSQMGEQVEMVVVDGGLSDDTQQAVIGHNLRSLVIFTVPLMFSKTLAVRIFNYVSNAFGLCMARL